jgi:tetratricopeptide (TPR) repeat protein
MRQGRYGLAAAILSLALSPAGAYEHTWWLCFRGVAAPNQIEACTTLIEDQSQTPRMRSDALVRRGNAWRDRRHDFDQAITDYDAALAIESTNVSAYSGRGDARLAAGQLDGAIADYAQVLALMRGFTGRDYVSLLAVTHVGRGDAYLAKRDPDRALADYDAAIAIDPQRGTAFIGRGYAYAAKGDLDRALAALDDAIRIYPTDWRPWVARCQVRTRAELAQAAADCDEAVRRAPSGAAAFTARGMLRLRRGEISGAIADYDRALKIEPTRADALYGRGLAKARNGDGAGSAADMAAAKAIKPRVGEELAHDGVR